MERNARKPKSTISTSVIEYRIAVFLIFSLVLFVEQFPIVGQVRPDNSIRVMSFNIRYDEPRDGENAWQNRKTKVVDVIRFHKADIVGFQEALLSQLVDIKTMSPGMDWFGVGRTDGKEVGEYSAIIYRSERFERLTGGTFWLSDSPDKAGSVGWDAAFPRIVTWGQFRDRRSKQKFYFFNTHFDHRGENARIESANLIHKKIAEIAENNASIVTGDLNVCEDSEAYKALSDPNAKPRLFDGRYASKAAHFGGDSTFSGFKELIPGNKIDYIFVTGGIEVLEHGVLSDQWNGLWASDHLPVLAEIVIRKGKNHSTK